MAEGDGGAMRPGGRVRNQGRPSRHRRRRLEPGRPAGVSSGPDRRRFRHASSTDTSSGPRRLDALKKLALSLVVAPLVLLTGGCDLPLDLPVWETAWTLPGTVDTVATAELLPEGVTMESGGFEVEPLARSQDALLGDVCPICTCFQGPIPSVTLEPQEWPLPLPGNLTRARLRRGSARLTLRNEIPFDLLDDGRGNAGFLTVLLVDRFSDGALDSVRVEGSLPPGDSVTTSFDLAGLELGRNLAVRVEGVIPGSGCDTVSLDPDDGLRADVAVEDVEASDVTVLVADAALAVPARSLEMPGELEDRLRPDDARLVLEVRVESSVALAMEMLLSVATRREDLFGPDAALFTPVLVEPPAGFEPRVVDKRFLLDLTRIQGADSLFIDTRNRVAGSRAVLIRGGEEVRYTATIHAELPSR